MSSIPPSLGGTDPRARSAFLRTRRRVGLALLAFAAALTLWTLSQGERTPLVDDAGPAACGERAPADATPVSLPRERNDAWNHLVGTVVCFTHELVVTELYDLGRHGALSLADRRLYGTGTGLEVEDDARHVVRLVAPGWRENAWPLPWGLDVGDVRVGDAVTDVAGRLGRGSDGGFDVVSVTTPSFEVRNPRPTAPPDVGGDLRIASFNVFNYFLTLGARGARDARELERQSAKLVAALALLDADVLALAEVENDDGEALEALALALNAALEAGGSDRRYARAPRAPARRAGDAIRQAFLYDPARVEVTDARSDGDPIHLRPPQAITVRHRGATDPHSALILVAVHHRSKGSCPTAGDVDVGYGCWNLVRSAQSDAVLRFATELARASGTSDVLVLGDLNAHRFEPPITLFERHDDEPSLGWEVLTDRVDEERAYSYVHFGRSAALDHAIASVDLAARVSDVAYWPINADEPPVADYRTRFNPPGAFRADPYRSSDHDPLVIGVSFPAPAP